MSVAENSSLKFQYTRNDYLAAMGARHGRTTRAKIELGGSILAIVLGILCLTFIQNPYLLVLGPYLFGLGLGALVLTIQHYGVSLRAMTGQDLALGDEQLLTYSEDGITLTSAHSSYRADWSFFREIVETDRVFLLFWAANVYVLIPKRAFPTPQVAAAFRDLAQRQVGGARAIPGPG
jgi:hypothetical protein